MERQFLCCAALLLTLHPATELVSNRHVGTAAAEELIPADPPNRFYQALQTTGEFKSESHSPASIEKYSGLADTIRGTLRTSPQQLHELTQEALSLAAKGATYSARAQFIQVLELAATSLDVEHHTASHAQALASGLLALQEADDFQIGKTTFDPSPAVAVRLLDHRTPILWEAGAKTTRGAALERYYAYASRQLAQAVSGSSEGSAALFYLGRLQPFLSDGAARHDALVAARMIVWQRAALDAYAENYRAANELGVVYANSGQYEAAKDVLICSAIVGRRPETLSNLGVVLHKLGDQHKARAMFALADEQRENVRESSGSGHGTQSIARLVDYQQFSVRAASHEISPAPSETSSEYSASTLSSPPEPRSRLHWRQWPRRLKFGFRHDGTEAEQTQPALSQPTALQSTGTVRRTANAAHSQALIKTAGEEILSQEPTWDQHELEAIPVPMAEGGYVPLQNWNGSAPGEVRFEDPLLRQGEYIGPTRLPHVPEYYLRVDDTLGFVFRLNGKPSTTAYRLNVGDVIRVSSLTSDNLALETLVQPDGTIVLPQIGSVSAAGKTIDALRRELDLRYQEFIREPSISVAPVTINKTLEELRNAIITRTGLFNGQQFVGKVSPHGMIQLPALGSVPAQGLTLDELRGEVELRYAAIASGLEVTPVLQERAPHFVYVLGEVVRSGRFELTGPTSAIQAISLAGGWNKGGNVEEVIVIRRDDCWRFMAVRVSLRRALYNKSDLCAEDIWLRDSDVVIVPKLPIQVWDDWIELVFTRGIYGVIPFNGISFSFFKDLGTLGMGI